MVKFGYAARTWFSLRWKSRAPSAVAIRTPPGRGMRKCERKNHERGHQRDAQCASGRKARTSACRAANRPGSALLSCPDVPSEQRLIVSLCADRRAGDAAGGRLGVISCARGENQDATRRAGETCYRVNSSPALRRCGGVPYSAAITATDHNWGAGRRLRGRGHDSSTPTTPAGRGDRKRRRA
jgi:hypothetical protein